MHAIYIAALLVLVGSDFLPSKVNAGSSKSSDSRDSKGSSGSKGSSDSKGDVTYCKQALPRQKAVEDKIKNLNGKKQPLPTCTCGTSGTISKIDIFDASCGKTTSLVTCSGCTGPQVPIACPAECTNVADCFRGDLDKLCTIVFPRCKSFRVYRCSCPAVSTTQARTTPLVATTKQVNSIQPEATTSVPSAPATTSVPSAPATTSVPSAPSTTSVTVVTRPPTPFDNPNYVDY